MESGKCLTLYAFYLYVACEQAVGGRSRVGKRANAERAFSQPLFPSNTYSKASFKKSALLDITTNILTSTSLVKIRK